MKNISWKSILLGLAAGLLAGVLLARYCVPRAPFGRCFAPPKGGAHFMVQRLCHRLDLTVEQKTKVESVFAAQQEKMRSLQDEMRPRFDEMRRDTDEKIRAVLNDDQKKQFDDLTKRWEERRAKKMGRWGGGPPPPLRRGR